MAFGIYCLSECISLEYPCVCLRLHERAERAGPRLHTSPSGPVVGGLNTEGTAEQTGLHLLPTGEGRGFRQRGRRAWKPESRPSPGMCRGSPEARAAAAERVRAEAVEGHLRARVWAGASS